MKRSLIIIGSAPGVGDDLAAIWAMGAGHLSYDYMAVGMSSLDIYPGTIKYIANNHPENIYKIRRIMQERHEAAGGNWQYKIIGPEPGPGVDIVEPYRPPTGSSAITGALAAIRMGYRKIILAGCPLTGNAPAGNPYEEFRAGWEAKKDELDGLVKSMSGWTKELLGKPTDAWLFPDERSEGTRLAELHLQKQATSRWEYLIEMARVYDWNYGAELGVWYGETFFNLLIAHNKMNLIGVDLWIESERIIHHKDQAKNRQDVCKRQEQYANRSKILEMSTNDAARLVADNTLDFVFIDANHTYAAVVDDIKNWLPKLKSGGFLTGHDYDWPTVEAAVNDCLLGVNIYDTGGDTMWAWRKP